VRSTPPARNRELSLPCVEVGYWSTLDYGRTEKGELSKSRQEEVRYYAREMLRAERGSAKEKELEAMLEQAGLEPSVVSIHPQKGNRCGSADVVLMNKAAATSALRHFTGFSWDHRSGKPVSSTIVKTPAPAVAPKTMAPKVSAKQHWSHSASDDGISSPCSTQSLASPPPGLSQVVSKQVSKHALKQRRHGETRSNGGEVATMATASTCSSEANSDCEIVEVLA